MDTRDELLTTTLSLAFRALAEARALRVYLRETGMLADGERLETLIEEEQQAILAEYSDDKVLARMAEILKGVHPPLNG